MAPDAATTADLAAARDADAPIGPVDWPAVLGKLMARRDLEPVEAQAALAAILRGEATDAQLAGFAVGLRAKGETASEIAALVQTMLRFAERVEVAASLGPLVDTCGTGGDRHGTFNISTVAAFVVAGAGGRVAKHGNAKASSDCGSADVLAALGVAVDLGPDGVARCIEEAGIGFCFARRYHAAMRHAGAVRAQLGVPTTFNFLGPLANPAGARRRALGVSDPAMAETMAGVLGVLGVERALVFYGHDGLDELTTTTSSTVLELRDGTVSSSTVEPSALGIALAEPARLVGGDAATNAAIARRVLDGERGPARDIVALNAAAGLVVAGLADALAVGVELAYAVLDDGRASQCLEALVEVSTAAKALEGS